VPKTPAQPSKRIAEMHHLLDGRDMQQPGAMQIGCNPHHQRRKPYGEARGGEPRSIAEPFWCLAKTHCRGFPVGVSEWGRALHGEWALGGVCLGLFAHSH
jgi:hypothetical protein